MISFNINGVNTNLLDKNNLFFSFYHTKNRHYLPHGPSNIGIDILTVGLIIAVADKRIRRKDTLDGWTRTFDVEIPVIEYDKWVEVSRELNETISFLSGDYWNFTFTKRKIDELEKSFIDKKKRIKNSEISKKEEIDLCMLSGGLDSFVGAIDLLSENLRKTIFVNIHGSGSSFEMNFQEVRDALCDEYSIYNKDEYFKSYNITIRGGHEDTTRSRSFTFFAHALALSTCYDNPVRLIVPENGTISLNVPLTTGRYGSCSTRTTHPRYIAGLQRIINGLGLKITIVNPYQLLTKGEMLINCKNKLLLKENISDTMSCSHPTSRRWHSHIGKPSHCGYCLPCLIRMAAELKGFGKLMTKYGESDKVPTGNNLSTLRCLKAKVFSFEKEDCAVEVLKNGFLVGDLKQYIDVYKKSMKELKVLLDKEFA